MGLIKFLWEDLKEDVRTVKKLLTSQEFRNNTASKMESMTLYLRDNFKTILKEYWIWYLLLIFAFVSGWYVASVHYQSQCNQFIYDTYIQPTLVDNFVDYSKVFNVTR